MDQFLDNIRKNSSKKTKLLFTSLFILGILILAFLLQLPKNTNLSQNQKNLSSSNLGISFNYSDNMIIYEHTPDSYDNNPWLVLVSREIPNSKNLYDDSNALCLEYKDPRPAGGSEPSVLKGYFMSIKSFYLSNELKEGYERFFQNVTIDGHKAYKAESVFRCGLKFGKAVVIIIPKSDNLMIEISVSYPVGFNNYNWATDNMLSSIKLASF